MTDKPMKMLLAAIAVALWILALRPLLPVTPAQAQGRSTAREAGLPALQIAQDQHGNVSAVYVVHDGKITLFTGGGRKLQMKDSLKLP
jgi:hypothetical protein